MPILYRQLTDATLLGDQFLKRLVERFFGHCALDLCRSDGIGVSTIGTGTRHLKKRERILCFIPCQPNNKIPQELRLVRKLLRQCDKRGRREQKAHPAEMRRIKPAALAIHLLCNLIREVVSPRDFCAHHRTADMYNEGLQALDNTRHFLIGNRWKYMECAFVVSRFIGCSFLLRLDCRHGFFWHLSFTYG